VRAYKLRRFPNVCLSPDQKAEASRLQALLFKDGKVIPRDEVILALDGCSAGVREHLDDLCRRCKQHGHHAKNCKAPKAPEAPERHERQPVKRAASCQVRECMVYWGEHKCRFDGRPSDGGPAFFVYVRPKRAGNPPFHVLIDSAKAQPESSWPTFEQARSRAGDIARQRGTICKEPRKMAPRPGGTQVL